MFSGRSHVLSTFPIYSHALLLGAACASQNGITLVYGKYLQTRARIGEMSVLLKSFPLNKSGSPVTLASA